MKKNKSKSNMGNQNSSNEELYSPDTNENKLLDQMNNQMNNQSKYDKTRRYNLKRLEYLNKMDVVVEEYEEIVYMEVD